MNTYDDDLKLFLFERLRSIDYLRKLGDSHPHIITHLGFEMVARIQDAGEHLF